MEKTRGSFRDLLCLLRGVGGFTLDTFTRIAGGHSFDRMLVTDLQSTKKLLLYLLVFSLAAHRRVIS